MTAKKTAHALGRLQEIKAARARVDRLKADGWREGDQCVQDAKAELDELSDYDLARLHQDGVL